VSRLRVLTRACGTVAWGLRALPASQELLDLFAGAVASSSNVRFVKVTIDNGACRAAPRLLA
jgi:hypothetical protein